MLTQPNLVQAIKPTHKFTPADFLLYSNLYLACGAAILVYATILIMGVQPQWEILFLPFANVFFVYTLNRYTDKDEDRINVPIRVQFFDHYGKWFLAASVLAYSLAFAIALTTSWLLLLLFVSPSFIGVLYSVTGLKKIMVGKNLSVGASWGSNVLLVGAFYNVFSIQIGFLFTFFCMAFFINTIIFDVKDIQGDKLNGIATLPVAIGVHNVKWLCHILNGVAALLIILSVAAQMLPFSALLLLMLTAYIFTYIYLCHEQRGRFYFGLFVDGEFMFLLLGLLAFVLLQP